VTVLIDAQKWPNLAAKFAGAASDSSQCGADSLWDARRRLPTREFTQFRLTRFADPFCAFCDPFCSHACQMRAWRDGT
jgi:hypothetical protein